MVGTAAANAIHGAQLLLAILALGVGLALQVGVNFANDYSDGVRGTDVERIGPDRLVATGKATPSAVKMAAFGSFRRRGGAGAHPGRAERILVAAWRWHRGDRRGLVLHRIRQAVRVCGLGRGQRLHLLWPGGHARHDVHAGRFRHVVGGAGVVLARAVRGGDAARQQHPGHRDGCRRGQAHARSEGGRLPRPAVLFGVRDAAAAVLGVHRVRAAVGVAHAATDPAVAATRDGDAVARGAVTRPDVPRHQRGWLPLRRDPRGGHRPLSAR